MTREEAIAKVESADALMVHQVTDYSVFVHRLVALGLLKLEEPKSVHQRMMEACRARDLSGATIDRLCEALDLAGLRVTEKQHGD